MTTSKDAKLMTLASKLAAIGKEIGAVDKSGRNQQQNYNYIEYGVVAGRIRDLFDKHHIIIMPNVDNIQQDEVTTRSGSKGYHYILQMSFILINGDDPEDREVATWAGEALDYGDKGINKAETAGTKYFLMRLFNISEKAEDNDANSSEELASTKAKEQIFSEQAISMAKLKLGSSANLTELKNTWAGLGEIAKTPAIIEYTNKLKATLGDK